MDANTTQILTLFIAALSSGFGLWISLQHSKLTKEVQTVKRSINGQTDLLMKATKAVGHAEGKQEERKEQSERDLKESQGS